MLGWLVRFALRRAGRNSGPAVVTLAIRGMRFTLDWAAAEHVAIREIVARGEYWPTSDFRPAANDFVVDVGANAGVFSVVAATWIGPAGRLIAIEPNPAALERLRRNLRDNGFADRSTVIAAALADRTGSARLRVAANTAIGTVHVGEGSIAGITVALETLDHLAAELALPPIDLLKVDVEGLEIATLDGAASVLRTCRRVVLEVSRQSDVSGVIERCRGAGFGDVVVRPAGPDSGATIVFARRDRRTEPAPS